MGSSTFYEGTGETTEFEDILREKGVLPPKEEEKVKALEALVEEAKELREAERDHLAEKSLDELGEMEDEYADSRTLDAYRRRRVEQLRLAALRNKFGRVYPLRRDEFSREVTEASREGMPEKDKAKGRGGGRDDEDDEAAEGYAAAGSRAASSVGGAGSGAASAGGEEGEGGVYVVVLLYKAGIPDSRLMEDLFARVAEKHKATKFMKIVADQCIEGYPDRNVPTLLVYYRGEVRANLVGLSQFGGQKATADCVEWVLSKQGAVSTELDEDPRKKLDGSGRGGRGGLFGGRGGRGDSDEDDD